MIQSATFSANSRLKNGTHGPNMKTDKSRFWILLRGLGRESGHWGPFVANFQDAFPMDRVVCLDLPGAGSKAHLNSPYKICLYTDHIRQELQHLNNTTTSETCGIGLSMGGMILLDWAVRFPREINQMVLINTSAANLAPPWKRLNINATRAALRRITYSDDRAEELILSLVSNDPEKRNQMLEIWTRISRERSVSRRNIIAQLLAAATFRVAPGSLATPTLIVCAKNDRLVDSRNSVALTNHLLAATLIEHQNAGHDIPIDDPKWLIDQVKAWVQVARMQK